MKRLTTIIAGLAIVSSSAFAVTAATTSTTTTKKSLRDKLKASKYSMSLYHVTEVYKESDGSSPDFRGAYNEAGALLNRKVGKNEDIRLYGAWSHGDEKDGQGRQSDMLLLEGRYRVTNIMSQDVEGLALNWELRGGWVPSARIRQRDGHDHYVQTRLVASRNFTNKFSLTSILRLQHYIANDFATDTSYDNRVNIYLTPAYTINDKWSVSTLFYYNYRSRQSDTKVDSKTKKIVTNNAADYVLIEPAISYSFSPDVTATFYTDFLPFQGHDQRADFADDWEKEVSYGLSFDVAAF